MCWGFDTWYIHVDALWRDLFYGTTTYDFVTFILNFDLVLKNTNLGYIFWTKCTRALILKNIDAWWRDIYFGTKTFDLVTFILKFDVLKNFNLDYIFLTKCVMTLILKI
jgi:hypothetical protein